MKRKFKNKLNITAHFLITLFVAIVLIVFINVLFIATVILRTSNISLDNPVNFTREFSKYVKYKNDVPYVIKEGKEKLGSKNAWIQILGEDFKEKYSLYKPKGVQKKYNPVELIHSYKYDIKGFTMFIGKSRNKHNTDSYLIGFPINSVAKYTMEYSPSMVKEVIIKGMLILFFLDLCVVVVVAYFLFGKNMGRPLENIIKAIKELSQKNYQNKYKESGIYKDVFCNLNDLCYNLKRNKEERLKLDIMRQEWISSISHDVKTPLSSILGYSEIMKEPDYNFSNQEVRDYSNIIWEKSKYIQRLIEELNLTYKLKDKLFCLNKEEVNIVEIVQKVIISILNNPLYSESKIEFNYKREVIKKSIDIELFERALFNLIFNAVIHNDKNIKIKVSIYDKKGELVIVIADNGKGISEKELPYIFERYYRGTNTSSELNGSGLGMAIAKQIVEAHRGKVSIKSKVEKGTIIEVTVPSVND